MTRNCATFAASAASARPTSRSGNISQSVRHLKIRDPLIESVTRGGKAASAVPEKSSAKRYLISGMVQGVGYRFFVERVAMRLGLAGYVKNLRDGRVEVYAIGSPNALTTLRAELERGPRAAMVSEVSEEDAAVDARYEGDFSIERDSW